MIDFLRVPWTRQQVNLDSITLLKVESLEQNKAEYLKS